MLSWLRKADGTVRFLPERCAPGWRDALPFATSVLNPSRGRAIRQGLPPLDLVRTEMPYPLVGTRSDEVSDGQLPAQRQSGARPLYPIFETDLS